MSEKPTPVPSVQCWDQRGAASAQPLHGSWLGGNHRLSAGERGYLTSKDCTAYLGIPGRCLHDSTRHVLQSALGMSLGRPLTRAGAVFSPRSAMETVCERSDLRTFRTAVSKGLQLKRL